MQAQYWYLVKILVYYLAGNSFAKFIRLSSLSTKLYSNELFNMEKELVNRSSIFSRCVLLIPSCVSLIFSNVLFNTETELVKQKHFFLQMCASLFFFDLLLT